MSTRCGSDEDFRFGVFFSEGSNDFVRYYLSLLGCYNPFSLFLLSISNQFVELGLHSLSYLVDLVVLLPEILNKDGVLSQTQLIAEVFHEVKKTFLLSPIEDTEFALLELSEEFSVIRG